MDWIEKATGKKKLRYHATEEERLEARRESKRKSSAKARAKKKAEREALVCLESSTKPRSND